MSKTCHVSSPLSAAVLRNTRAPKLDSSLLRLAHKSCPRYCVSSTTFCSPAELGECPQSCRLRESRRVSGNLAAAGRDSRWWEARAWVGSGGGPVRRVRVLRSQSAPGSGRCVPARSWEGRCRGHAWHGSPAIVSFCLSPFSLFVKMYSGKLIC